MKIAVIGSRGMLGSAMVAYLQGRGHDVKPLSSLEIDITKPSSIEKALGTELRWDVVINCAAFTAVDLCETHHEDAFKLNADAPKFLGMYTASLQVPLVHFSTEYVFSGDLGRPYVEDDIPNPISVYGESKWQGEKEIQAVQPQHYIFRLQWLYGPNGKNFVDTILKLASEKDQIGVVNDQWGTPSYTDEVAKWVVTFLEAKSWPKFGIYHLRNEGFGTWYDLASLCLKETKTICLINALTTAEFPRPAKRPQDGRLSIQKFLDLKLGVPESWEASVVRYLHRFGQRH